ncbi:MAG: DUF1003 domain-containing protein [Thermodesulfobacteriota bacterium]|jgi:uncharacterized membrane protein|nr:MAG: DUF1003 domain-containing protein [Thermodesulfobacteriota bacterium]
MIRKPHELMICQICKEKKKLNEVLSGELVRPSLVEMIQKKYPDWSSEGFICRADLNRFRTDYIQNLVEKEMGELSTLELDVMRSMKDQELLSKNVNVEFDRTATIGERVADKVAEFGGSWGFITTFTVVIVGWIIMNSIVLFLRPFDPYPFILLNLVLSCVAAFQAPIIMMSQNRQEAKDRLRSEHDYQINLKAELEIRHLNEKLDHLLAQQWQRLVEIQQIQMDLMEELARKTPRELGG